MLFFFCVKKNMKRKQSHEKNRENKNKKAYTLRKATFPT